MTQKCLPSCESVASWHLGGAAASAVKLRDACQKAIDYVAANGGDPRNVFVEVEDKTYQPNLAQLVKMTLSDESCIYELIIQ